jgi:superfamily II DNA or RNA helicase
VTDDRPYQTEAIAKVRAAMSRGAKRIVLVIPTGGGKTRIASRIVQMGVSKGKRWLWLAHRTELIGQAGDTLGGLGLDVGLIAASSPWPERPEAPVQVASVATLLARGNRPKVDGIVADECHHFGEGAEKWSALLREYPDVPVVGLTATPERGDGTGLAPMFDSLVVGATVRQLTTAGYLVPCVIVRPARWLKHGMVKGNPLAWEPLDAYRTNTPGESCLLFARSIDEAERYAAEFTEAGIASVAVSERTSAVDRFRAIEDFKAGKVKVLCNVFVFTEGTDLPSASVCLVARGAGTVGTLLQMIGRVLRPAPGKDHATWIDLQGLSHVHGVPEDERVFSLEGKAIKLAGPPMCPVCQSTEWDADHPPCPQCGYVPGGGGPETETTITGDKLEKYWRKLAESAEQRKETLSRWLIQLALKGHVPGRVLYKWKAVYAEELTREAYLRGLADLTHDGSGVVSEWARMHLARIRARRAA